MKNAKENSAFGMISKWLSGFSAKLTVVVAMLCMCSGVWAEERTVTWTASNGALNSNPGTISTGGFEWSYERTGNNTTGWQNSCVQVGKKIIQLG